MFLTQPLKGRHELVALGRAKGRGKSTGKDGPVRKARWHVNQLPVVWKHAGQRVLMRGTSVAPDSDLCISAERAGPIGVPVIGPGLLYPTSLSPQSLELLHERRPLDSQQLGRPVPVAASAVE